MYDDVSDIIRFTGEIGCVDVFVDNKLYHKAIIMSILNIGELAKQLPDEYRLLHLEIPWKKIMGMRDIAAHGYHKMDDDIIWDTAVNSIPMLADFLEKQLGEFR